MVSNKSTTNLFMDLSRVLKTTSFLVAKFTTLCLLLLGLGAWLDGWIFLVFFLSLDLRPAFEKLSVTLSFTQLVDLSLADVKFIFEEVSLETGVDMGKTSLESLLDGPCSLSPVGDELVGDIFFADSWSTNGSLIKVLDENKFGIRSTSGSSKKSGRWL